MNNNINIKVSNDNGLGQVGIWFKDNNLEIVFPKNYTYNESNLYNDINLLSSCFDKYFKKLNQKSVLKNNLNDMSINGREKFSFMSLFNIINDYIENGYYFEIINCTQTNGKSNIDFTRTMNKFSPYLINNDLLFIDHTTQSRKINYDNNITEIHRYIVEKCFDIVGLFFPKIEYDINCNLPFPVEYCINILEKAISETFNDDRRLFLERLLSFFKISKVNESNITFYSTNKFENIWEEMLHELLGNEPVRDYYFNSSWTLVNSKAKKTNFPSRPDVIHVDYNDKLVRCFIIDAKYYTYSLLNEAGTLPSTSDINKQILYKLHAENVVRNKFNSSSYEYINLFLLPKEFYADDEISYLGYAMSDFNSTETVHAFSLDIKYVMNTYVNIHRKYNFQNYVLNSICKSIIKK
ncbi:LlaJI family restriction endonuclease [Romboutsia ilealis]|uniref:LlaJI family restriction endonuclease n=1 Tax=Romboutsia faecis TaxID=2764597 RepID=A0ABR7JK32_9FIRM|nr:LlaJI family restriction endonuclease [Romboutsia faecis]MBC5995280.1 LlaJI family restriction endonuclease [Romboutsia faecis]MRN24474.1 LlaJI family restriction endonuclease [Romboutsia ilealis]